MLFGVFSHSDCLTYMATNYTVAHVSLAFIFIFPNFTDNNSIYAFTKR